LVRAILERHLSVQAVDSMVFIDNSGQSGVRVYARASHHSAQ
jgi:hypothetical protein